MTDSEIQAYSDLLQNASNIVEFGIGGSTLMAVEATNIQTINSVESDKAWVEKLTGHPAIAGAVKCGRLRLHQIDIGPTSKWGKPNGKPTAAWREYYEAIWRLADVDQLDLVFIDGRFRVQCALMAAISCRAGTRVVIHDYFTRPYYQEIEAFLDYVAKADSLVVFAAKAEVDKAAALAAIEVNPYRKM